MTLESMKILSRCPDLKEKTHQIAHSDRESGQQGEDSDAKSEQQDEHPDPESEQQSGQHEEQPRNPS